MKIQKPCRCWVCRRTYEELQEEPFYKNGGFPPHIWKEFEDCLTEVAGKKYFLCMICRTLISKDVKQSNIIASQPLRI